MKNQDPHVTTSNIIPKGEPVIHQRPTTRRGKFLFSLKPFVGGEPRPGNLHKQSCPCKPYISCPAHAETMIKSNPQNRNELHPPKAVGGWGSKRNNSTSHPGRKVTQAPQERHNKLSNTNWLMLENFNKTFVDNGSNRMISSKP